VTLIAETILALLAVALVLEPLLRPVGPAAALLSDSDDDDITPEQRRRDLALAAIKEIEFDQATGKLSDVDYDRLYRRYAGEAMAAMKDADAPPAAAPAAGPPASPRFCEECGARLEGAAKFCSECGERIAA